MCVCGQNIKKERKAFLWYCSGLVGRARENNFSPSLSHVFIFGQKALNSDSCVFLSLWRNFRIRKKSHPEEVIMLLIKLVLTTVKRIFV